MATSYTNPGGTGNRTATVAATANFTPPDGNPTKLVDGSFTASAAGSTDFLGSHLTGNIFRFDFNGLGVQQIIDEIKFTQQLASDHGAWGIWGAGEDLVFTQLATGKAFNVQINTWAFTNAAQFRYYELRQETGNVSTSPWLEEVEFKIQAGVAGFVHSSAVMCC